MSSELERRLEGMLAEAPEPEPGAGEEALHRALRALRPAWFGLAGVGVAMLPRWARRMYRLPGLPTTDVGATAAGMALRTSLLALHEHLRHGPHYRDAMARLAA